MVSDLAGIGRDEGRKRAKKSRSTRASGFLRGEWHWEAEESGWASGIRYTDWCGEWEQGEIPKGWTVTTSAA